MSGAVGLEFNFANQTYLISLVDIDTLKPHEEIIEPIVKSLTDAMGTFGLVRDPLIVDRDKKVILDGMHRHSSFKSLGCRFAPCCLVDYDNPLIKVGSWFRLFKVEDAESLAEKLLKESNLNYTVEEIGTANPTSGSRPIILTQKGKQYALRHDSSPINVARTAVALEKAVAGRGYHADYLPEDVALQNLKQERVNFVIAVPVFTKQQIRDFGTSGPLLPHKTTRHVIPSRPLRIDIPLGLLRETHLSQVEADVELREILSTRRVESKPPGSVVDGRRYEEELLVFTT
jgi:hypothetical protein